jgi:HAD superfamily hydrolase (TIGR01450 family)
MDTVPEITIDALIARYDVLLLDAYGVLVDSSGALPGAAELTKRLSESGKPYYILTNDASRLPTTAAARYRAWGLAIDVDRIITSGLLLKGHFAAEQLVGARCAVLGPGDSLLYVEEAGGRIVPPSDPFDVLVIADESGFPFLETVDLTLSTLFRALDRQQQVHLVLANSDLIYPSGRGFGVGSGSIALILEAAMRLRYPHRTDLRFVRLGKPHAAMFAEALRRSGTRNMVVIGDQLETDIGGASAFGLDSVLVDSGVTSASSATARPCLRPTYVMRSLRSGWAGATSAPE